MPDKNQQSGSPEKRLVLFVANNEDEIKLCCQAIKAQTPLFAVEVIKNGRQALDALAKNKHYDLVVMDFEIPDMNGEEWVKSCHKLKPQCPIIVITANDSTELAFQVIVAGASDFLPKLGSYQTFLPRALVTNIQRAMLLENVRDAYQRVEQSSKDEALLNRLIIAIHGSLDLDDIIDKAAQSIALEFKSSRTAICTISDNLDKVKVMRQVTTSALSLIPEKSTIFARYHDLLLSMDERRPLVVNEDDSFPFACDVKGDLNTYGIKSMLMVPLLYRGRLMGFLHLDDCYEMRVWTPAQINLLTRISNQLAIAISQAKIYQILDTQSRSIDKLTDLCSQLNNVVNSTQRLTQKQESQERVRVKLSTREIEVLQKVAEGLSNREIADTLHITEGTTEVHVSRLRKKLNLGSRAALVRYAYENHLAS
jgi:DNA-binding NarL/FixJ family response regulator